MDIFYVYVLSLFVAVVSFLIHFMFNKSEPAVNGKLPPGQRGWPVIGESVEFLANGWKGHPEKFFFDRMNKFSPHVFRTSLMREDAAVFCGPAGNKFLFSNENKLVQGWLPDSVHKIFPSLMKKPITEQIRIRKMLHSILKAEVLFPYVPIMDMVTQKHFETEWEGKDQIVTHEVTTNYSFSLACKILVSIDEPKHVKYLSGPFKKIAAGIFSIPIDLPGTPLRRGINAANFLRKELLAIVQQRKIDLAEGKASPTQDILSHMLIYNNEHDKTVTEINTAGMILGLLSGGHDNLTSTCTAIVKYLAELPAIYEGVHKEQMEIRKSKASGELLKSEDVSKMKYSWNVACEALRLAPPLQGSFREAITDLSYKDYFIPKGWKLYWSTNSTHKNPELFPEPEKFDPSRFGGKGPAPYTYVPFGGGPHLCAGKEYSRLQILVFMHHLVTKFKWEKVIPDEQIVVNTMPKPAKGLPIRLYHHKSG